MCKSRALSTFTYRLHTKEVESKRIINLPKPDYLFLNYESTLQFDSQKKKEMNARSILHVKLS